MPATPKSPRSIKKTSTLAKPKGAVRAKSGCYTCRIRRKKCDEKRIGNEDGPCETCLRLKLECLGFGAKRPDWLRETSRVSEIRDRIKAHLAAQGMIKGHAGSGSRSAVHDDILRLSDFRDNGVHYTGGSSSSSASTPRRADSVESDNFGPNPPPRLMLPSSVRPIGDYHYPHHIYPVHSDIPSRSHSPFDGGMPSVTGYPGDFDMYPPSRAVDVLPEITPATRSSFSKRNLYHFNFPDDWDSLYTIAPDGEPIPINPDVFIPREFIIDSLRHYVDNVVKIQYLLGDGNVLPTMIWTAISSHHDSYEAVELLSKAYHGRQENPFASILDDESVIERVENIKLSLKTKDKRPQRLSADDAMTALHVISLYLFDGGRGDWYDFLQLAVKFVEFVLEDPAHFHNYPNALEAANSKVEFVVKTTIWFDVLASVTTRRPPLLLYYIRELFRPDLSWVGRKPQYSMMSPMGCENTIVWALAETSYLSYWKSLHEKKGSLSIPELVRKVADIEQHLRPGPRPEPPQQSGEDWSRYLASEIFRTSTRLFLKTVESGDYPDVPEIRDAADAVFGAITKFPNIHDIAGSDCMSAVLRSTVFGIYIGGSLTNEPAKRTAYESQMTQIVGIDGVGNVKSVLSLLQKIWEMNPPYGVAKRDSRKYVPWRRSLKDEWILLV